MFIFQRPEERLDEGDLPAAAHAQRPVLPDPLPEGKCIKIGLPGKSILRDYFQENMTSRRPFLLLIINFPGRLIFTQSFPEGGADPVVGAELQLLHLVRGARRRRLGRHRQARHRLARGGQSILLKVLSPKVTILIPRE